MLNENKIYELSDEELDKVNGGAGENVGVVKGGLYHSNINSTQYAYVSNYIALNNRVTYKKGVIRGDGKIHNIHTINATTLLSNFINDFNVSNPLDASQYWVD